MAAAAKLSSSSGVRALTTATLLLLATLLPAALSQTTPVVWYPFYDAVGSSTAVNAGSSGAVNDGNLGFVAPAIVNPTFTGTGLSYNNQKFQFVNIDGAGFATTFTSNPAFSITTCARFNSVTNFARLFDINPGNDQNWWVFFLHSGNVGLGYRLNNAASVQINGFPNGAASPIVLNKWQSIAVTFDSNKIARAYIDGVPIGDSANLFALDPTSFVAELTGAQASIGNTEFPGIDPALDGILANWRYYSSALSPAEIQANSLCEPSILQQLYDIKSNTTIEVKNAEGRIVQNTTIETKNAEGRIVQNTTIEIKSAADSVKQNLTTEIQNTQVNILANTTTEIKDAAAHIKQNLTTEVHNAQTNILANTTTEIQKATQNLTIEVQNAQANILANTTTEIKDAAAHIKQNLTTEVQNAQANILANTTVETKNAADSVKQNLTIEVQNAQNTILSNTTLETQASEARIIQNTTVEVKTALNDIKQNVTQEIQKSTTNLTIQIQKVDTTVTNINKTVNAINATVNAINATVNNINTTVNNINTTVNALNTRLGCLNATSDIFKTTPGLGCNGFDDNCNGQVDECTEDQFKPFFINADCQPLLANRWVTTPEQAKQVLCDTLKPRDDCSTDDQLQLQTTRLSGTCKNTLWNFVATDKCGNSQSRNYTLPYYPTSAGLNLTLGADITTFTQKSFFLKDIGFKINATDTGCPGANLGIKLTVWADEGYAPTYDKQDWRKTFAQVVPQTNGQLQLTGYSVWLLPNAFKTPCDPKYKVICSATAGAGYSRNYVIEVTITNPAGISLTKTQTISVSFPFRRRQAMSAADAVTGSDRVLHPGQLDPNGQRFKIVEVEGVLGQ